MTDYADLDYAALKEEIDSRNASRDDDAHISKGGGADQLRERLVLDDSQAAEPDHEPGPEPDLEEEPLEQPPAETGPPPAPGDDQEPPAEDDDPEPDEESDEESDSEDEDKEDDGVAEAVAADQASHSGEMRSILAGPSTYDLNPLLARGLER